MPKEEHCFNIEVAAQIKRYKHAAKELENSERKLEQHGVKISHVVDDGEIDFTIRVELDD